MTGQKNSLVVLKTLYFSPSGVFHPVCIVFSNIPEVSIIEY